MGAPSYNCVYSVGMKHADDSYDALSCAEIVAINDAAATLTSDMTAANADITLTAKTKGDSGNRISVTYVKPDVANAALSVSLSGKDITVNIATNGSKAATSTATLVMAALEADANIAALVTVAKEGSGAGVVNAKDKAYLAGGAGGCQFYNRKTEHCILAENAVAELQTHGRKYPTG
jgi:phage tail sheath gpL-like